jgi:hypothetical protein
MNPRPLRPELAAVLGIPLSRAASSARRCAGAGANLRPGPRRGPGGGRPSAADLMAAGARRRGAAHVRQLVVLGDGAVWIWNLATQHFPEATQIAGLYHAREHLHDLARLLEFMLGDRKQDWLAARLDELDEGDIGAICAAARTFPLAGKKAGDLGTALGYFEHNAHRMQYARFKKLGMFAGSGAVEAGCTAIAGQRCKLSGMRWPLTAATGILTLRCLEASDRWEKIPTAPGRQADAV